MQLANSVRAAPFAIQPSGIQVRVIRGHYLDFFSLIELTRPVILSDTFVSHFPLEYRKSFQPFDPTNGFGFVVIALFFQSSMYTS